MYNATWETANTKLSKNIKRPADTGIFVEPHCVKEIL